MPTALRFIEGAVLFAAMWASGLVTGGLPGALPEAAASVLKSAAFATGALAVAPLLQLYDPMMVHALRRFAVRLVMALAAALVVVSAMAPALPWAWSVLPPLTVRGAVVVAALVVTRFLLQRLMQSPWLKERVLVIGASPASRNLVRELRLTRFPGAIALVGERDGDADGWVDRPHVAGALSDLPAIVARFRPHRIVVGVTERRGTLAVRHLLEQRVRGVIVEDALHAYERVSGRLPIDAIVPSALLFGAGFRASSLYRVLGGVGSVAVSAVALVLCAPLGALIALAIKLDSPGPVFFVHNRVGADGRVFGLIKFRTMHQVSGPTTEWVRDNADRITRVGRVLRKFRLDELPQFINVLCRHMNLVGPRPHPVSNYDLFMRRIPYYSLRSSVRPGITGWAQVRYGYANSLHEEAVKMEYDLYYIKHQSPAFDLRILFETLRVVLVGLGDRATTDATAPAETAEEGITTHARAV